MLSAYPESAAQIERPSSWFAWHAARIPVGGSVLDLACGTGRHALAAAGLGARVTALDRDPAKLETARREAQARQLEVTWIEADLEREWPALGTFDTVLVFNFLDRRLMPRILESVGAGGMLLLETFLEAQRAFGWGPSSDAHLLRSGELAKLVAPLMVLHGREAIEAVDNARWSAVASVLALRK